jgi:hypothetical protein
MREAAYPSRQPRVFCTQKPLPAPPCPTSSRKPTSCSGPQKCKSPPAPPSRAKRRNTYDDERQDFAALRAPVDKLIKNIWDHIEFTYREDPGPSKRRKSREWGLTYVTRPGETPDPGEAPAAGSVAQSTPA